MVAVRRALARSLGGLLLVLAGCTHFQWSSEGPGAPGPRTTLPEPTSTSATRLDLPPLEEPAPFSTEQRERIAQMQPWVERAAQQHQMDPDLINGVIWVESRFQPRAKSPAGAQGLMQLMPATAGEMARQMGRARARSYDPEFNVQAGSLYLLKLLDRFDGDETLALAAYNAGAGNVNRWMREDGELPPRSLQYVENVQRARMRFIALREQRMPQEEETMFAAAPAPERDDRRVPPPPRSRDDDGRADRSRGRDDRSRGGTAQDPSSASDEPVNPLAPDPDVYRPEPTPEPPLQDTPYPPILDEPKSSGPSSEPIEISRPKTLPSVLD